MCIFRLAVGSPLKFLLFLSFPWDWPSASRSSLWLPAFFTSFFPRFLNLDSILPLSSGGILGSSCFLFRCILNEMNVKKKWQINSKIDRMWIWKDFSVVSVTDPLGDDSKACGSISAAPLSFELVLPWRFWNKSTVQIFQCLLFIFFDKLLYSTSYIKSLDKQKQKGDCTSKTSLTNFRWFSGVANLTEAEPHLRMRISRMTVTYTYDETQI